MSERREHLVAVGRWVFLAAVLVAAVLAFRGRTQEVLDAMAATPPWAVVVGLVLVVLGLLLTSVVWLELMGGYGHRLPGTPGRAVFFVGQLGKYVPGGLWSIGAQAHLAAPYEVPGRVTAGASLAFLGLNVVTAGLVAGVAALTGVWDTDLPTGAEVGLGSVAVLVATALLLPRVLNRLGSAVAGRSGRLTLGPGDVLRLVVAMVLAWACYAGALVVLSSERSAGWLATAAAAFAVSYVVGVVVVVAPAGVGAREVTLVALLTPVLGVAPAGAVAVLTRLVHTAADLLLALATWLLARRGRREPVTARARHGGADA